VAALAHKRLVDLVEALDRKVRADLFVGGLDTIQPVSVNAPERRVLALASAAKSMFEAEPRVTAPRSLQIGQGLSQFAVAGSAGFELPGYADVFAPGGTWVADAVRSGTPDRNFSTVVVGTTQFAVRAGEIALGKTSDDKERERIRAFSMGMLSAVAAGVVTGPVFRGLQAGRTRRDWSRHEPAPDLGAAEGRILRNLLGGSAGAAVWQGWWPASDEVPGELFEGYAEALEEAYRLAGSRPRGFADFERDFAAGDPLRPVRLRNAYAFLRQDMGTISFGPGVWWLILAGGLLMPPLALLLARELEHGKALVADGPDPDERSAFEVLVLGMGLGSLWPFAFSMGLWHAIDEHTEPFVTALVTFVVRAVLVIAALATMDDVDQTGLERWLLIFAPLVGTDVYALVRGIAALVAGGTDRGRALVFLIQTLALGSGALVLLVAALVRPFGEAIDSVDGAFVLLLVVLTLGLLLGLGIPLASALSSSGGIRSLFLRERSENFPLLDSIAAATGLANPAALAHLFDDSGLWHDPATAAPTLADLRFPAGRRALVRLFWTGAGALEVSHVGNTVTFRREDGTTKAVRIPPNVTTALGLAALLRSELPGLDSEAFAGEDPAYRLPFPQLFADPGDTLATVADHDLHAADFTPVGTTRETAYLLRHTPRGKLTTTYGLGGPSGSSLEGFPVVPERTLGDLEYSALGLAADLAVLLCMGAAPSLSAAPITTADASLPALPNPTLDPVYQVFRQWNLDERRVNEWRMLVSGGAESEKGGRPRDRDPAMRPNPNAAAPAYASPADAGERLATAMGWIPLWRAWLRMATDVTASTTAATAMPYTPLVPTRDGRLLQPSNADLSTAVRFLLDLAA
jgi:hypothetical protein